MSSAAAMTVNQCFDVIRIWHSGYRNLQSRLARTGNSNRANIKNALEKSLIQLHVANVLVPHLSNGFRQNPLAQTRTLAGYRQRSAFAFEPPNQKNDQADHDQAKYASDDKPDGLVAKHRWMFFVQNGFFVSWF